jgi:hypothetical protein
MCDGLANGLNHFQISQLLGRSPGAVKDRRSRLHLPRRNPRHPPKAVWEILATEAATEAHVDPVKVMAGDLSRPVCAARWRAWKRAHELGYSLAGIGATSGFNHATLISAFRRLRQIEVRT